MRWIFTSISQPIASVNPQERYLSYPLGLAWWAAAGLKIVALSTFMATAVVCNYRVLDGQILLWYFENGCSRRAYAPQLKARGSPIAATEVPDLLRGPVKLGRAVDPCIKQGKAPLPMPSKEK
jgi:hypothetical protein